MESAIYSPVSTENESDDNEQEDVQENKETEELELSPITTKEIDEDPGAPEVMMQSRSEVRYFGEDSWFRKLIRPRTPMEVIHLLLQFWCLLCGAISLYLSAVFYMNLLVEYILNCIAIGWVGLFAGIAAIFLVVCVSWLFRRKFESLIIMTRNTLDFRHSGGFFWRFFNFALCILFTVITTFYNQVDPFSDILFYQIFLLYMVLFALSFQILYVLCTIAASIIALIYQKSATKFYKILCGIEQHDEDSESWAVAQYVVLSYYAYSCQYPSFYSLSTMIGFICSNLA